MPKKHTPLQVNLSQFSLLTGSHALVNRVYFFFTQSGPLFFRNFVDIERFAFRAAILDECQNDITEK